MELKSNREKILYAILIGVIVILFVRFCVALSEPVPEPVPTRQAETVTAPDGSVTAAQLVDELEQNASAFTRRYRNRSVIIYGKVESVGDIDRSKTIVRLYVEGRIITLTCWGVPGEQAATLSRGDVVSMRCEKVVNLNGMATGRKCEVLR